MFITKSIRQDKITNAISEHWFGRKQTQFYAGRKLLISTTDVEVAFTAPEINDKKLNNYDNT